MAENSKIEWTDATWNPIKGCSRVSAGCAGCYAENMAARFSDEGQWGHEIAERDPNRWTGKVVLDEAKLLQPLAWRKPRRIFVTSIGDPFHPEVTDDTLDRLFAVMALCPQHTFQLLTKRPERMREYMSSACGRIADTIIRFRRERGDTDMVVVPLAHIRPGAAWWPLPNLWLGTSVENQAAADERIPHLLAAPAALRFLSCEPLLGPVNISRWTDRCVNGRFHAEPVIDWLIAGGESGQKARPMHPEWVRGLRDQCASAGVPFLFKQWGEWLPGQNEVYPNWDGRKVAHHQDGRWGPGDKRVTANNYVTWESDGTMHRGNLLELDRHFKVDAWATRVGKKAAGRQLDGRVHDQFPEMAR